MGSVRLNEDNRNELIHHILVHKFAQREDDWLDNEARLADEAWRFALGGKMAKIAELAAGWLPEVDYIKVALERPGESPLVFPLHFGGCKPRFWRLGRLSDQRAAVRRRVPFYLTKDPFMIGGDHAYRFVAHYDAGKDLETEIERARVTVRRELIKFGSSKKLREGWPEIAEFVSRIERVEAPVPAHVPESINRMLDLPPT